MFGQEFLYAYKAPTTILQCIQQHRLSEADSSID